MVRSTGRPPRAYRFPSAHAGAREFRSCACAASSPRRQEVSSSRRFATGHPGSPRPGSQLRVRRSRMTTRFQFARVQPAEPHRICAEGVTGRSPRRSVPNPLSTSLQTLGETYRLAFVHELLDFHRHVHLPQSPVFPGDQRPVLRLIQHELHVTKSTHLVPQRIAPGHRVQVPEYPPYRCPRRRLYPFRSKCAENGPCRGAARESVIRHAWQVEANQLNTKLVLLHEIPSVAPKHPCSGHP